MPGSIENNKLSGSVGNEQTQTPETSKHQDSKQSLSREEHPVQESQSKAPIYTWDLSISGIHNVR